MSDSEIENDIILLAARINELDKLNVAMLNKIATQGLTILDLQQSIVKITNLLLDMIKEIQS